VFVLCFCGARDRGEYAATGVALIRPYSFVRFCRGEPGPVFRPREYPRACSPLFTFKGYAPRLWAGAPPDATVRRVANPPYPFLSSALATLQTTVYAGSKTLPISYSTHCPRRMLEATGSRR